MAAANTAIADKLEHLADDPYGAGWFIKIKITNDAGLANLLDEAAYKKQCEEESTTTEESIIMPDPILRSCPIPNTDRSRPCWKRSARRRSTSCSRWFPPNCGLNRGLCVPPGLGEMELTAHISDLAAQNTSGR